MEQECCTCSFAPNFGQWIVVHRWRAHAVGESRRKNQKTYREGGAWVATFRDMNVDVPLADSRRIEILANGLPLWQGAQVAVDTTFVSPVSRHGSARAGPDRVPGKAAVDAGRRKRQTTYPALLAARRCRLVVLVVEVGGRFGAELADFLRRPRRLAQPRCDSGRRRQAASHRWAGMFVADGQLRASPPRRLNRRRLAVDR